MAINVLIRQPCLYTTLVKGTVYLLRLYTLNTLSKTDLLKRAIARQYYMCSANPDFHKKIWLAVARHIKIDNLGKWNRYS